MAAHQTKKKRRAKSKTRSAKPRKPAARSRSTPKPSSAAQPINATHKGITQALEPPIDRDLANLREEFRSKLASALADLAAAGTPFKLVEGFRTTERQQWLFGSGRPSAPFGRPGPIVTNADGVSKKSNHQGNGAPGSGSAADCYPMKNGKVFIPPSSDPVWTKYADAAEAHGLKSGHRWKSLKDSPHCEL